MDKNKIIKFVTMDLGGGVLGGYILAKAARLAVMQIAKKTEIDIGVTTVQVIPDAAAYPISLGTAFLAGIVASYLNPLPSSKYYSIIGAIIALKSQVQPGEQI
jgi:hypothetical protein